MHPVPPVLIIRAGSTFPALAAQMGDFTDWITTGLGPLSVPVEVIDPRSQDLPMEAAGVVMTGSHTMVTDHEPWSEAVARWLPGLIERDVPVLGICYGHQLLAHALGGSVGFHPGGIEIGTVEVRCTAACADDPLFGRMPETFPAQVVHRQSVAALPHGEVLLAANDFEPHHAYRFGRSAWGVQFHPEFSAAAMKGYVAHLADDLTRDGMDPTELDAAITSTPAAAGLLRAFGAFVEHRLRDHRTKARSA